MILVRGADRFSTVRRSWQGERVVLIGGGPSLTFKQVQRVWAEHDAGGVRCVAVNDAYLWAPWADVCYFADPRWWRWHHEGVDKPLLSLTAAQVRERFASFEGQKCSIENTHGSVDDDGVHILRNAYFPDNGYGLSTDPAALVTGKHGGFQTLNLAVLAGAKEIILLGYDAQGSHFHGGHPKATPISAYATYRKSFAEAMKPLRDLGVNVVNCSPGSAIDVFPKMRLEDALGIEMAV